jgi:TolB-like protein
LCFRANSIVIFDPPLKKGKSKIKRYRHYHAHSIRSAEGTKQRPADFSRAIVAVLPFESLSKSKSDAYFADGVQDEILNNLARISQLKVICHTSVMQYRADTKRDLRQIANALGVANVLEGTVRRDGNHVRVSTELVDDN